MTGTPAGLRPRAWNVRAPPAPGAKSSALGLVLWPSLGPAPPWLRGRLPWCQGQVHRGWRLGGVWAACLIFTKGRQTLPGPEMV